MPERDSVSVKDLALDLGNYRTVRQSSEASAVEAMISTSPDRFWALTESLLKDGYLPTETIIVLRTGQGQKTLTVKEGNRRIGALKLILGLLPLEGLGLPDSIAEQVKAVSPSWRTDNKTVPCALYDAADGATVDRIVTLAHGKGEKAGRDQWNAVARARHNREANKVGEPALDLLEKYLQHGKNVTPHQKARWAGDYPLSVLAEAIKRLAPRLGCESSPALAKDYPAVKHRDALEAILHAIGQDRLGFDTIRQKDTDFAVSYGIPPAPTTGASGGTAGGAAAGAKPGDKGAGPAARKGQTPTKPRAYAISDPKAVHRLLREFVPRGKKREKVVTLRDEAVKLNLVKTPLAFCFVLRSIIEISAKAYCSDNGLSTTKPGGSDKTLVEILRAATNHLTANKSNKVMVKALHGAMTELGRSDGLLSVTSLNQLVHNPRFSVTPSDIAMLFGNVFPLVEAMNS